MRTCDSCSLCCRLPYIAELEKRPNVWCEHCTGHACRIYELRPEVCRGFACIWLRSPGVADRYRPDLIGLYVATCAYPDTLQVFVDPDRPNAWQEGLGKNLVDYLHERGLHLFVLVGDDGRYFIKADGKDIPPELRRDFA